MKILKTGYWDKSLVTDLFWMLGVEVIGTSTSTPEIHNFLDVKMFKINFLTLILAVYMYFPFKFAILEEKIKFK